MFQLSGAGLSSCHKLWVVQQHCVRGIQMKAGIEVKVSGGPRTFPHTRLGLS